jgi:3-oxoacyl-[acyl-carrier protein] reductase
MAGATAPATYFLHELAHLRDKVVLITGASRGIGRITAELFAGCGARVAINGRDEHDAQRSAREISKQYGADTIALPADVSNLSDVAKMFEALSAWSSAKLDILVCNAGYPLVDELWLTPLHEIKEANMERWFTQVRAVDLDGARFCAHRALQMMVPQKSGALVFVSATPALAGYKGTPYTEAKAGLLGLMRDIAVEYAPLGIRANAVAPGNIASGWYHRLAEERITELAKEAPMGRWGEPKEVAGTILFLASELAGYITGQTIVVDGGEVIR